MGAIIQDRFKGIIGASYSFTGMNNVIDPTQLNMENGDCELLLNVDPNNTGGFVSRSGYTQVIALECHSGWSNTKDAYFVSASILYHFDGTTATPVHVLSSDSRISFEQINDLVYFTSLTDKGLLDGSRIVEQDVSTDPFKVEAPFGQLVTYYNGRLYIANGSDVYCTDAFDRSLNVCDGRRYLIFSLDNPITLLAFVDDGIYVGSNKEIAFLQGEDPYSESAFTVNRVSNYGAIFGTQWKTTGSYIPVAKAGGSCVVFTSDRGICVGANGGNLVNLSLNKVSLPIATVGASLLREQNGLYHYLVALNKTSINNQYIKPTIDVDQADV